MSSRQLILVDGTCLLYRSYYAIKELSTREGRPTNAVFGFVRQLRKMREEWAPTHWLVAFDGGRPRERLDLLAEYKAQRPSMPDPLREQIEPIEEYLNRAGIPWVRRDGEEADDLLASVAARAAADGAEVLIATSDKDMYQLVTESVRIIGLSGKGRAWGVREVREKTGVMPEQIVEWLALIGDSVDNIPGVKGVGPKTASALLHQFGSLAGLWSGLDGVGRPGLRQELSRSRDLVDRNVEMIRLRRDLDYAPGWDDLRVRPEDPEKLLPLFRELEFASLVRDLTQPELFEE
jgi:DNA polymerase-1